MMKMSSAKFAKLTNKLFYGGLAMMVVTLIIGLLVNM